MKKNLILTAAAFAALSTASHAQTISLQYTTNGSPALASTDIAGEVPADNFNVQNLDYVNGSGATTDNLVNSAGVQTGVSATVSSIGGYDSSNGNSFTGPDHNFLSAYALTNYSSFTNTPLTLTLSGLNPNDTYTLYTYVYDNDTTEASLSAGGSTYFISGATNPLSSYTLATSTDSTAPTTADYAEFSLNGSSSETFTLTPLGGSLLGLSGFQLVDSGTVSTPEPASVWLLGLGVLGLGFFARRFRVVR